MQKGQSSDPLGFYKLEWNSNGLPRCQFTGVNAGAKVTGSAALEGLALAARKFHPITCIKTSDRVTIRVDTRFTERVAAVGSISNTAPVSIGGKANCGGTVECDYFRGRIDRAQITKG